MSDTPHTTISPPPQPAADGGAAPTPTPPAQQTLASFADLMAGESSEAAAETTASEPAVEAGPADEAPEPAAPPADAAPATEPAEAPAAEDPRILALTEQVSKLTELVAQMAQSHQPATEAAQEPARDERLANPYYAQAIAHWGADIPPHLLERGQAAFENLHSWQRLAGSEEHGQKAKVQVAQWQREIAAVDYEAGRLRQQADAAAAAPAWSTAAKHEQIEQVLAKHSAEPIPDAAHLTPSQFAGIMMGVPAGDSQENWATAVIAAVQAAKPAAQPATHEQKPAPKNPAPATPSENAAQAASPYRADRLPSFAEVVARAHGMAH